jgi:hypothetical protein
MSALRSRTGAAAPSGGVAAATRSCSRSTRTTTISLWNIISREQDSRQWRHSTGICGASSESTRDSAGSGPGADRRQNAGQRRSGKITGFEAQVSTFFDFGFVPDFLRNFGVQANYTYIDGKVDIEDPLKPGTFFRDLILTPGNPNNGVSKHTFNLVGLYEGGPFSARLTYNKRSNYLERRDLRGDEEGGFYREFANPAGRLDFSANFTVNENATVFFDATNLTGEPFRVNFSSARAGAPRAEYVRFLRYEEQTFSLGLRFRL